MAKMVDAIDFVLTATNCGELYEANKAMARASIEVAKLGLLWDAAEDMWYRYVRDVVAPHISWNCYGEAINYHGIPCAVGMRQYYEEHVAECDA